MPFDFFVKLLDSLPGLEKIKLQGIGEPLLHPRICDMTLLATRRNIATLIFTNGTVLRQDTAKALFENGLGELTISCDHYDPAILNILRPGLGTHTYNRNVETALALGENVSTRIGAWALLTKPLAAHFEQFVCYVKGLGFRNLSIQNSLTSWGAAVDLAPFATSESEIAECRAAAVSFSTDSFHIDFVDTNAFTKTNPCPWPFHFSFVTCDGFVQPCCIMSDPGRYSLGSLNHKRFGSIWNSWKMLRLRNEILKDNIPEFCKGCYGNAGGTD